MSQGKKGPAQGQEIRPVRRAASVDAANQKHLSENNFWQQAQSILASILQKEEYDESFYIDTSLAEDYPQSAEVKKYLDMTSGPRCLLLVGSHGVGKSSIIRHSFNRYIDPSPEPWAWIYFDGNIYKNRLENDLDQLIPSMASTVYDYLPRFLSSRGLKIRDFILDVFENDPGLSSERFFHSDAPDADKIKIATDYLESKPSIKTEVALRHLSRTLNPNRVVFVLDNLDPLDTPIQAAAVRQLLALAVSCHIKGIVAIRKKAEAQLSYSHPSLFYQFIRTQVQTPPLSEVIRKRVGFAIRQPEAQNAKLGEGALVFRVRDCPEFEDVLVKGLSPDGIQKIIEGVSNGSVRQALRISLSIYASPLLDPKKIVAKLSPAGTIVRELWRETIPHHIAVRSILLRTARMYDEDIAWVKNVFGTTYSNTHLGPFLRLHVLRSLQRFHDSEILADSLSEELCNLLAVDKQIVSKEIRWLAKMDWVEHPPSDHVSITRLGRFISEEFVSHRDYLSCISTDVDMYPDLANRLLTPTQPSTFRESSQNMIILLDYLARREAIMLQFLSRNGLREYCDIFGSAGFTPEIIKRVLSNLRFLRSEEHIELAINDLYALMAGEAIRKIQELMRRYGGAAE